MSRPTTPADPAMPTVDTKDQTGLFYRDWGKGQGKAVVFCAGWTLSSDMWRSQMLALSEAGMRCVAYDRRGHGRSDDPGGGYDYDTLSDDLAALLIELDLNDVCLVGHSMAGGELIRYLSRHGNGRVDRIVLLSSVVPALLAGPDNPDGVDPSVFEPVYRLWRHDFGQWLEDNADAYVARDLPGNAVSQEIINWTQRDMQRASFQAVFDCYRAMIETDWRAEMRDITVPTLLIHGDSDASIPLEASSRRTVELILESKLKVYEHGGHGMYMTHADRLNMDLLEFCGVKG
jgi:non-heme chloroperoxidase